MVCLCSKLHILHLLKQHGKRVITWWRNEMEIFFALLAICAGNSPVTGEFPAQRPVTRSFDVFFNLRLNKRLSKQSWCRWFVMPSCPIWRHCNEIMRLDVKWIYQAHMALRHASVAASHFAHHSIAERRNRANNNNTTKICIAGSLC